MPNRHIGWDMEAERGNPTRSLEVQNLIKSIKRLEVRRQGKPSAARRPMEMEEMRQLVDLAMASDRNQTKYYFLSYLKYQFHLMARNDCTAHLDVDGIMGNPQHRYTLLTKLRWSKNINEEREAPEQIMIGADNWKFCVILGLAIHFELWIESGLGMINEQVFGLEGDNPRHAKDRVRAILGSLIDKEEFVSVKNEPLGTHSIRKCARTFSRRAGNTKDDNDCRGRWKRQKTQGDVYEDTILPYPDAKVAATLAIGGAVQYCLREGSRIDGNWIRTHVIPNTSLMFEEDVTRVLGPALLWACFDREASEYVPLGIKTHAVEAYNEIEGRLEGNPVMKRRIIISGNEDQLAINELVEDVAATPNQVGGGGPVERNDFLALQSEIRAMRQEIDRINDRLIRIETTHTNGLAQVNANIGRIAHWPAQPIQNNNENLPERLGGVEPTATLSSCPRTLYVLWQEWEVGIGGRKAARLFTARERGRVKYSYHRRKVVWDAIQHQVYVGHTAERAIDRIYNLYGVGSTVTTIINHLRRARNENNGQLPPELR